MSAMIVLKTTSDVASSSSLEAAWDISKTDIAVGAADGCPQAKHDSSARPQTVIFQPQWHA